jgi:nitroreductase
MSRPELPQADVARCVGDVLRSRRSVRAFRAEPVPADAVREILQEAACAPSGGNIQPWHVHVLTGAPKQAFSQALLDASRAGKAAPATHFPDPLPNVFRARVDDFASRYYGSLGIAREDALARARQSLRNFSFFGAPVGLIFSIDRRLKPHSWLDLGLFMQGVMIAAKARGIDTCPQVSFAPLHGVIAEQLRMNEEQVTVCGMSMGYGDTHAQVNQVRMPREQVDGFACLHGFETAESEV